MFVAAAAAAIDRELYGDADIVLARFSTHRGARTYLSAGWMDIGYEWMDTSRWIHCSEYNVYLYYM